MPRIISFALGNIWRWEKSKNRDDLIKYAKNLGVDGIELTFSCREELLAFKLSPVNEKFLKNLDYVTIHAPFGLIEKADSEQEVVKQLEVIAKIYQQVGAKNVVIHPDNLPEKKILDMFNFKVSTENLRKKKNITIADFGKIFEKYPKIGLCLDVSHAYSWSKQETANLIKAFGDRITQFHFSGSYRNKDHQSMRKVSPNFLSSIKLLFKTKAPIVIEEDIKIKSERYLQDEVEFIKKMFM
ncbi:MAG: TIM barrel protein [Candidatus Gribaldobacteria bacterium]|nr:TIM barrel protein [Candidatus Gribaldobacteria bacterium]